MRQEHFKILSNTKISTSSNVRLINKVRSKNKTWPRSDGSYESVS